MHKKLAAILLSTAITAGTFAISQASVSAAGDNTLGQNNQASKGWIQQNSKWYYYNCSGVKNTGWLLNNGKWYFLNTAGDMQIGWLLINNKWYYFNTNGDMAECSWICTNNKWYYLNSNGDMAVNTTTPDGYQVGSDGSWIVNSSKTDNTNNNLIDDVETNFNSDVYATTTRDNNKISAPENVQAEALYSTCIKLTWGKVVDADYYYVYYKEIGEDKYTKVKKTNTSYTLTGIDSDSEYYFKVTAVIHGDESDYSDTVYGTTDDEAEANAPEDVAAEAESSSSIEVSWNKVDDAHYYYVYYKELGEDDYTKVKRTTTHYILDDLNPETKVTFKVTALIDGDESDYSDIVSATTDEESNMDAPEDVEAVAESSSSIKVSWDEADDADYYYVYYKINGDDDFTKVKETSTSYTIADLDPDTKAYFKIKAVNGDGDSEYSDTVSATTDSYD